MVKKKKKKKENKTVVSSTVEVPKQSATAQDSGVLSLTLVDTD